MSDILSSLKEIQARVNDLMLQLGGASTGTGLEETIDGVTISQYMAAPDRATRWPGLGWKFTLARYARESLPHPWVDWGQGVLPSQAGDNTDWIAKYEKDWRPMWQNATTDGVMEPVVNLLKKGEKAFVDAFSAMYWGPWGQAWLENPATVGMRPKNPPVKP